MFRGEWKVVFHMSWLVTILNLRRLVMSHAGSPLTNISMTKYSACMAAHFTCERCSAAGEPS